MTFQQTQWQIPGQIPETPPPAFAAIEVKGTVIRVDAIDVIRPLPADRTQVLLRSGEWVEVWAPVDEVKQHIQNAVRPTMTGGYVRD